jgi:hypothetical protein
MTTPHDTKTIDDLRTRLFAAIDGVKAGTLSLDQARTISDLSQVIVNTAKVEVDYLRATGGGESTFIDTAVGANNLPPGITGIVRHRLGS